MKRDNSKELFEILVPTVRNDGRPIHLRFHRVWDKRVRAIAGGLSILSPIKGEWIAEDGVLFQERNISVRIACTEEQMLEIARMSLEYYEQKAIMYYKVSNDVTFIYKSGE